MRPKDSWQSCREIPTQNWIGEHLWEVFGVSFDKGDLFEVRSLVKNMVVQCTQAANQRKRQEVLQLIAKILEVPPEELDPVSYPSFSPFTSIQCVLLPSALEFRQEFWMVDRVMVKAPPTIVHSINTSCGGVCVHVAVHLYSKCFYVGPQFITAVITITTVC